MSDDQASMSESYMDELKKKYPILQYFVYAHLPVHLQEISKPFSDMAWKFVQTLPQNPETSAGLRKLLEAKDCLVRAALTK